MTRREEWKWLAAASLPVLGGLVSSGGLLLGEDAYRYLSGAENLTAGRGVSTSLLHYDTEHATGRVPAPLTMHPAGYPLAVAGVHSTGLSLEHAAGLVSALAFVVLIPVLAEAARVAGVALLALRFALAWLLLNSWSLVYPVAATTESLFTALTTASVGFILAAEIQSERVRTRFPLIAGGLVIGVSFWVSYAGLLVFAGVLTYYGLRLLQRRSRMAVERLLLVAGPAAVLIGAKAIRNISLTESWTPGHGEEGVWTILGVAKQLAASIYHLLLGDAAARLGLAELLLAAALIIVGVLAIRSTRRPVIPAVARPASLLLGTILVVYAIGVIAFARLSFITVDTRALYPLLPLVLLAGALMLTRARAAATRLEQVVLVASLLVATAAYAAINSRSLTPRSRGTHVLVAQKLAPLENWIEQNIPAGAVIVATDGPATGYVMRRPTISLAPAEHSATRWTQQDLREIMTRFDARFLILYPGAGPADDSVQAESVFLTELLSGDVPDWLVLAAESSAVRIFQTK